MDRRLGTGVGCALHDRFDRSDMEQISRPTGQDDSSEEWTLFAVGLEALVEQFFEIDPDWSP